MGETAKNEALAAAQSVIHGLAGRQRVAA